MKHYTTLILLFLSLSITACGGGETGSTGSIQTSSQTQTTGTKSISIRWDIPTTRVDSALLPASEISGYKIYISTNTNSIPFIPYATVADRSQSAYTINNLQSGTYILYVTTYDTNGDESPYSTAITKII